MRESERESVRESGREREREANTETGSVLPLNRTQAWRHGLKITLQKTDSAGPLSYCWQSPLGRAEEACDIVEGRVRFPVGNEPVQMYGQDKINVTLQFHFRELRNPSMGPAGMKKDSKPYLGAFSC